MHYAIDEHGLRVEARRGVRAICPCCHDRVVARCGEINQWHWSHRKRDDCDSWAEPETLWHRSWKQHAPTANVEVPMGPHRADILAHDGTVIELQHSPISQEEIREREQFYEQMVWVLDGSIFQGNFRVARDIGGWKFHWAPVRPTWLAASKFVFVHGFVIGNLRRQFSPRSRRVELTFDPMEESRDLFQVLTLSRRWPYTGTGRVISIERFVDRMLKGEARV